MLSDAELQLQIERIRGDTTLPRPPRPVAPVFTKSDSYPKRVKLIQRYIYEFEYNHTDQNYFNVNKERPYGVIMASARDVTRECLPIKCMEAVMLALLLTNSIPAHAILRLPLRFKTKLEGHTFRHIVLAVRIEGKWGALGLSRKSTLEHKPLEFPSLSALIADYRVEYERLHHTIRRFSVGLPITLDDHSTDHAFWTCLLCPVWSEADWLRAAQVVEAFVRDAERMLEAVRAGLVLRPIENTVLLDEASSAGTGEGLGRRICMIAPSHPHHHERQQQLDRAMAKASRRHQPLVATSATAEPMSPGASTRSRDRSRSMGRALSLVGKSATSLPHSTSVHANDSECDLTSVVPSSSDVAAGSARSRMMLGV